MNPKCFPCTSPKTSMLRIHSPFPETTSNLLNLLPHHYELSEERGIETTGTFQELKKSLPPGRHPSMCPSMRFIGATVQIIYELALSLGGLYQTTRGTPMSTVKGPVIRRRLIIHSRKLTWKPKRSPIKTTVPLKCGFPC